MSKEGFRGDFENLDSASVFCFCCRLEYRLKIPKLLLVCIYILSSLNSSVVLVFTTVVCPCLLWKSGQLM